MIERVRVEGVIDVFQTVRELRNQRPAMVQTKVKQSSTFCTFSLVLFQLGRSNKTVLDRVCMESICDDNK